MKEATVETNFLSNDCYRGLDVDGIFSNKKAVIVRAEYNRNDNVAAEVTFKCSSLNQFADLWEAFSESNNMDPDAITNIRFIRNAQNSKK